MKCLLFDILLFTAAVVLVSLLALAVAFLAAVLGGQLPSYDGLFLPPHD